jgi:uncharacterized membrane protein YkvA (DUF1232 family)
MENFLDFVKVAAIVAGVILVLLIILLSLPNSPLRKLLLKVVGGFLYAVTAISILYIISPADLLPDVLPLLGQVDDAAALITGVLNLAGGTIMLFQGRKPLKPSTSEPGDPNA